MNRQIKLMIMKIKLILFFLIFLLSANCFGDDIADYKILLNAKSFSVGGTGYSGVPTAETIAFKHIFLSENADKQFIKLMANANLEGKLYALCGLYFHDQSTYKRYLDYYLNIHDSVTLFSGCKLIKTKVSDLMKSNKNNVLRLRNNMQTIAEWTKLNDSNNGFSLDFFGAGYPQLLKEYINSKDNRIHLK